MADVSRATQPRSSEGAAAPARDAACDRLRLRLRELSIQAGLGAGSEQLALPLRDLFRSELVPRASAPAAERLHAGTALVHGVCSLVRWFDPARTLQAGPPLSVALWHVGRGALARHPATLWIDVVLPDDARRLPAVEWATDVRLLLVQAGIPHRVEAVRVPPVPLSALPLPPAPRAPAAWGCMSLWHAYRCGGGGVRGAMRCTS